MEREPASLQEAIIYFADPTNCRKYLVERRWPNGVECPTCGCTEVRFLANQNRWWCPNEHPKQQFSLKTGTIYEESPLGLDKWLTATWLITNCKNGVSSCEIARALKITQKSAWFMDHRIRVSFGLESPDKLTGHVEADETFIGGKARNMHKAERARKITGTGGKDKTAVMGIMQRGKGGTSKVRTAVIPNRKKKAIQAEVRKHVEAGSALYSDALQSYNGLDEFQHQVIDHAVQFSKHTAESGIYLEYHGDKKNNRLPDPDEIGIHTLKGDGDFRSEECIKLLKQADVVVTNPPFSLFREYVAQLVGYGKKFLIIGTWNAITYKEIFKLIKDDKIWIGVNSNRNFSGFIVPDHYPLHGTEARIDESGNRIVSTNTTCWFTNIDNQKRHEDLILYRTYNPKEFRKYDNYNAIEVSKTADIPMDYKGVMGVPVTFLDKYNPEQFEIIGSNRGIAQDPNGIYGRGSYVNGKETFKRLFIRNKKFA